MSSLGWSRVTGLSLVPWLQLPATALTPLAAGERAIRDYQFVADAWRQADSALQPYVAEAHQALERLTVEPRR